MASNKSVDDAVERAALVLMPHTVRVFGLKDAIYWLVWPDGQPMPHFVSQILVEHRKLVSQ